MKITKTQLRRIIKETMDVQHEISYYVEDANESYPNLEEALVAAFATSGPMKMASISLYSGADPFDNVLGGVDFILRMDPNFPLSQPAWGGYYIERNYFASGSPFIRDSAGAFAKLAVLALQKGSASMKHGPTSYDSLGRGSLTTLNIASVSMWAEENRDFSMFTEQSLKQYLIHTLSQVPVKIFKNMSI